MTSRTRFGTLYVLDFELKTEVGTADSQWLDYPAERGFPPPNDVLRQANAMIDSSIPMLATVALVVDVPEENLTRGQIGTVVEHLEADGDLAELVEFADTDGQAYAIVTLKPEQLLVLHRRNRAA